jgi:hypothetical protein
MRLTGFKTVLFAAVMAMGISAAVLAQGGQGQGQAAPLQNLQVLPKDMTRQQVTQLMRSFTAALGVECSHCHVGTMQERFKDDNPKKGVARKMIQMTAAINNDMLKGVGDAPAAGTAKVTCFTCHRGAIKPLNAPSGGGGLTGHDR